MRLNLYFDDDFYEVLRKHAGSEYMKTATWVKCYLKKQLLDKNNFSQNIMNQNGTL